MATGIVAIVPAHNEARYIKPVINSLNMCLQKGVIDDYRIVNNGSTDSTKKIAENNGAKGKVITIREKSKGLAFLTGARWAANKRKNILLTFDADLEIFNPMAVSQLLAPLKDRNVDMAYAFVLEPTTKGKTACEPEYSGQRAIRISALLPYLRKGSVFENILKRKGFALEILLGEIIKRKVSVGAEFYIDYGGAFFKTTRAPMHNSKRLRKEQLNDLTVVLRYLRRYRTAVEKRALTKKYKPGNNARKKRNKTL